MWRIGYLIYSVYRVADFLSLSENAPVQFHKNQGASRCHIFWGEYCIRQVRNMLTSVLKTDWSLLIGGINLYWPNSIRKFNFNNFKFETDWAHSFIDSQPQAYELRMIVTFGHSPRTVPFNTNPSATLKTSSNCFGKIGKTRGKITTFFC